MAMENNDIDVDMFSQVQTDNEVQTKAVHMNSKKSFLAKCLHPPSAVPGFDGIPTNDARTQVLAQWRSLAINNPPLYLSAEVNPTAVVQAGFIDGKVDLVTLVTTGARINGISFVQDQSGIMRQDVGNVDYNDAYDFTLHWQDDANLYRPCYKSLTTYLNATAFNDTGIVAVQQFNPNILFAGNLRRFQDFDSNLFYQFVKDRHRLGLVKEITLEDGEMDDYKAYNQFPSYIRAEIARILQKDKDCTLNISPNTTIQVVNFGLQGPISASAPTVANSMTPTMTQMLNNSMRSYGGKAKEGTFSVNRLNTITPAWLAASNTVNGNNGLYECWSYTKGTTGQPLFIAYNESAPIGTTQAQMRVLKDTLWSSDMTWSWVYYSGLTLQYNASNTSLIAKKYYSGFEIQPTQESAWSGMTNLAPKPDLEAMQAMMDAFYDMKDGMPCRYNFWGGLAKVASAGIKTFGSSLLSELTGGGKSEKKEETTEQKYLDIIKKLEQRLLKIERPAKKSEIKHEIKKEAKHEAKKEVQKEEGKKPKTKKRKNKKKGQKPKSE